MVMTDYRTAYDECLSGSPTWLQDLRKEGFAHFERVGWPTRRHEEWKYTSTKGLQEQAFVLASSTGEVDAAVLDAARVADSVELVFVDGVFSANLSRLELLPAGVTVKTFASGLDDGQVEWLRPLQGDESAFAGLNAALFQDGLFVNVADKIVCEPLIHVIHVFRSNSGNAMAFPRQTIQVGSSAAAAVLETVVSGNEAETLLDAVTDIRVAANGQLAYGVIQAESDQASQIQNTRIHLAQDSRLESYCLTTGGKWVRNELRVTLDGSNIDAVVNGLYTVKGEQHVDNHTVIDHREPNSLSSQLYKGVLDDQGRAVFNGKIFVRDIAQQTNAYQLNQNLLLSPTAEADTKPQLEIFADDVRCTHGATVGPVNPDEIFYLQTRGISRERSIRILARGFARDAVARMNDARLRPVLERVLSWSFGEGEV